MKKVILSIGIVMFTAPFLAGAQVVANPVMPPFPGTQDSQPTSCAIPIAPVAASDWTSTITCLISRISDIENRLMKLEKTVSGFTSTNVTNPAVPPTARDACKQTSADTWVCEGKGTIATPVVVSTEEVKAVQGFLKAEGSFAYPTVTGYYGNYTKEAVYKFQEKNGLVPSGAIDPPTLEKMETLAPQVAPTLIEAIQKID